MRGCACVGGWSVCVPVRVLLYFHVTACVDSVYWRMCVHAHAWVGGVCVCVGCVGVYLCVYYCVSSPTNYSCERAQQELVCSALSL